MFISITETGPTTWLVEVLDSCWNVYESIITQNLQDVLSNFKNIYQID